MVLCGVVLVHTVSSRMTNNRGGRSMRISPNSCHYRAYRWWVQHGGVRRGSVTLCHYWQVVLFLVPLTAINMWWNRPVFMRWNSITPKSTFWGVFWIIIASVINGFLGTTIMTVIPFSREWDIFARIVLGFLLIPAFVTALLTYLYWLEKYEDRHGTAPFASTFQLFGAWMLAIKRQVCPIFTLPEEE